MTIRGYLVHGVLLICLLSQGMDDARAQNLIPNPSFEDYTTCPATYGNGGPLEATPWQNGNLSTADYFNTCATGTDVWIPDNLFGSQAAHTGNAYAGFYTREISIWREYIQAPLISGLTAGTAYEISFYVSLADLYCGVEYIGAYFSAVPPPSGTIGTLGVTPQVESNIGFITESNDWVLISGCFVAQGGEQWITIGNFRNNAGTPLEPGCGIPPFSYYYIDDVSLVEGGSSGTLELELGDPVTTCTPYEINPGVTESVTYTWSNGSHGPTLIVTTSGMYALTITAGCGEIGIDSVEITFIGVADPVQIGPPSVTLCEGESYGISLDPGAGDYLWQDGSTSPNYTITLPGLYQVTLNDGCDVTTDEIQVYTQVSPPPFSLGDDMTLCSGDEINFTFDPALGNFLWQDGSASPEYTITTGGNYSLTITNACGASSDAISVTMTPPPVVDLGPASAFLCQGETLIFGLDPDAGDYLWQDGSTSPTYTINASGVYSVTLTNTCGAVSDEIAVEIAAPPEPFSLGHDTMICTGEVIVFSFDPAAGSYLWQDQSTSSVYSVTTAGTYSLTISNACGEASDDVIVEEMPVPDLNLGPDQVSLCEGETIQLAFDPQMGAFLWQDGSTASEYTISQTGIYALTLTNACGTASDQIEVSITEAPLVDLGPDIVVCPAQLPILLDAGQGPNAESYLWQDQSTGHQITVTAAGTYSVTVSNSCFEVTDQIMVSVEAASPVVVLPPDQSLCEGNSLTLSVPGLIGEYQWQDGSTSDRLTVTEAGTYALTVSNACGSGQDSIVISIIDTLAQVDLGPDFSLCPGESFVLQPGFSGSSYLWQDMSTADSMIVTQPGIYHVMISNACSIVSDTVMVVSANNPPDVDLPDSLQLCAGTVMEIQTGISGVQYAWSNGAVTSSVMISAPGTYAVTVSNACGSDMDSVYVADAGSPPFVSLEDNLHICPGQTVLVSPLHHDVVTWLWSDGSTDSTYTASSAGIVGVQVSNQCGTSSDSISIILLPPVPLVNLGTDTALCQGDIITFTVPFPGVGILWQDGSTAGSLTVDSATVVHVTLSGQCGTSSDTLMVTMHPPAPVIDLGPDQSLCPGERIVFNASGQNGTYVWHDGSSDSVWVSTVPGWVALTVSNTCGTATDSVLVLEDTEGPQLDLGPDVQACAGEVVALHTDLLGVDYNWSNGSTGNELHVTDPGDYVLQVGNACGMDADTVSVFFVSLPPGFDLGPDTLLCPDQFMLLQAPVTPDFLTWQDDSHDPMMIADGGQTYWLEISNGCGSARDEIHIDIDNRVPVLELTNEVLGCDGKSISLDAAQSFDALYAWSTGQAMSSIEVNLPGRYTVTVTTACHRVSQSVEILPGEHCDQNIYIPNIFSPNGDQVNDAFRIFIPEDLPVEKVTCSVFDRWGNHVFQSTDEDFSWDGRYKNKDMMPGVYVYLIRLEFLTAGGLHTRNYSGDVTLVR